MKFTTAVPVVATSQHHFGDCQQARQGKPSGPASNAFVPRPPVPTFHSESDSEEDGDDAGARAQTARPSAV